MSRLATALIRTDSRRLVFSRRVARQIQGHGAAAAWGSAAVLAATLALFWLVS